MSPRAASALIRAITDEGSSPARRIDRRDADELLRVGFQPPEEGAFVRRRPGRLQQGRRERGEFARRALQRSVCRRRQTARAARSRSRRRRAISPRQARPDRERRVRPRRAAPRRRRSRAPRDRRRAESLRNVGGERFDGVFERRDAVRKRIEVAALDTGLSGVFASCAAAAAVLAWASALCEVAAISSTRRARAPSESLSDFVCASAAARRLASAASGAGRGACSACWILSSRDEISSVAGVLAPARRGVVSGAAVSRIGTEPASQSPARIAATAIAPATAPKAYGFARPMRPPGALPAA